MCGILPRHSLGLGYPKRQVWPTYVEELKIAEDGEGTELLQNIDWVAERDTPCLRDTPCGILPAEYSLRDTPYDNKIDPPTSNSSQPHLREPHLRCLEMGTGSATGVIEHGGNTGWR